MLTFNARVAALPRVAAERSLQIATATAAAWGGKGGQAMVREWQRLIEDGARAARGERLEGPSILALLKAANDKARAEGTLWEQRTAAAGA